MENTMKNQRQLLMGIIMMGSVCGLQAESGLVCAVESQPLQQEINYRVGLIEELNKKLYELTQQPMTPEVEEQIKDLYSHIKSIEQNRFELILQANKSSHEVEKNELMETKDLLKEQILYSIQIEGLRQSLYNMQIEDLRQRLYGENGLMKQRSSLDINSPNYATEIRDINMDIYIFILELHNLEQNTFSFIGQAAVEEQIKDLYSHIQSIEQNMSKLILQANKSSHEVEKNELMETKDLLEEQIEINSMQIKGLRQRLYSMQIENLRQRLYGKNGLMEQRSSLDINSPNYTTKIQNMDMDIHIIMKQLHDLEQNTSSFIGQAAQVAGELVADQKL
jgi:cell division septum initiation protein DivIVA